MPDGSKSTDPKNSKLVKKATKSAKKDELDSDEEPKICVPKKPISSYFFFNTEYGAKLREENPTNTSMKYIAPLVKEKWDTMNEQQRKPYEDLAEKDKSRF